MKARAQVFLSYAREDVEKVEDLYQKLSDTGFKPWVDTKDILPGERWESSIHRAIRRSDFFLACLSANSVSKRGFLQKEIREALDIWQEKLDSDIYLIPVRLEDCEAPESLSDFQWVDLFEDDGWTQLVKAMQVGIERQEKKVAPIVTPPEPSPTPEEPVQRQAPPTHAWWRRRWTAWVRPLLESFWDRIGPLIGLVIAILACIAVWLIAPPIRQGLSGLTLSPTATATTMPATILSLSTPTPSPSPLPTSTPTTTPTDTPTHTSIPPTNAPTSTHTATPPIATSPTPTPSPTPYSTDQPAEAYPTPVLNRPEDGANPGPNLTFSWRWDGQLRDNEYFDLRMWPQGSSDHRLGVMDFRQIPRQPSATGEYVVTASIVKMGDRDRSSGIYYWSVAVMREVDGKMTDVSLEATPHKLIYTPLDDGGGGSDDPRLPPPEP